MKIKTESTFQSVKVLSKITEIYYISTKFFLFEDYIKIELYKDHSNFK